jgi:hypothetical protein
MAFLFCSSILLLLLLVNHSKFVAVALACGIIAFKLAILDASDRCTESGGASPLDLLPF